MKSKKETLELLEKSASAYYNNETPILTDEEYDNLVEYAENNDWLQSDSKLNDLAIIKDTTIKHKTPMLSLQKAKTENELRSFYSYLNKINVNNVNIEPKLDGLAISLIYDNGNLVQVATRGDGEFGEDVSYIMNTPNLTIENMSFQLNDKNVREVRGEIFCRKSKLQTINENRGEAFKNERIAAAGIIKKAKLGLDYKAELIFVAYSSYDNNGVPVEVPITILSTSNVFNNEYKNINNIIDLMNKIQQVKSELEQSDFPTDGIVIKPTQLLKTFEITSHHPKHQIAWKYPSKTEISTVKDVVFQVGKTGRLTPVAIIHPVVIDNVTIENITLHNLSWVNEMEIEIGSVVEIMRANDVIPAIKSVIKNENTQPIKPPTNCPICHSVVVNDGKFIKCSNEYCDAIVKSKLENYVSRNMLDIEGMNIAVIEALNVKTLFDLLNTPLETLENLKYDSNVSLGKSRAKMIYDNIQKAKMNTSESVWLACLDIPNISTQTAKTILRAFGNIDNFLKATQNQLYNVNGLGDVMVENIVSNRTKARQKWEQLKTTIQLNRLNVNNVDNKGSFCVTGKIHENFKNRDDFVRYMENRGYTFHSSVKYGTDYLITLNPNDNSSKLQKARKLGVNIVNFDNFI